MTTEKEMTAREALEKVRNNIEAYKRRFEDLSDRGDEGRVRGATWCVNECNQMISKIDQMEKETTPPADTLERRVEEQTTALVRELGELLGGRLSDLDNKLRTHKHCDIPLEHRVEGLEETLSNQLSLIDSDIQALNGTCAQAIEDHKRIDALEGTITLLTEEALRKIKERIDAKQPDAPAETVDEARARWLSELVWGTGDKGDDKCLLCNELAVLEDQEGRTCWRCRRGNLMRGLDCMPNCPYFTPYAPKEVGDVST